MSTTTEQAEAVDALRDEARALRRAAARMTRSSPPTTTKRSLA